MWRSGWRLGAMAALLALAACNPVETWRDWTGASRNDPDPETTPNSKNLAAGEASDYPNLATVPPPPSRAMTAADREKLTQSLIADRVNARYSDEQLRAGVSTAGPAPPPPPALANEGGGTQPEAPSPPGAPEPKTTADAAPPEPKSNASTAALEPKSTAPTALLKPKSAAAMALPTPLAPAPSPITSSPASADSTGGENSAAPSDVPRSARAGAKGATTALRGLRKPEEPPEPGPMESSLEIPQARATPQPEQIQPAPPPPQLPPAVATTAKPVAGGLAAGGVLAARPLPEATSAAGFEPAPAPPQVPPPVPVQSAEAAPAKGGPKPPAAVDKPVAEVKFAGDSTSVSEGGRQTLETVVPLYRQNPGKIRIVGYAPGGGTAVEKLNGYRTALDRAHAVAAVLTKAGIPSDKVEVEAAPAGADSGESRAEVLLEH
jgi:outer membrane protein OmpA-like peptidoglycan-associated protein